jgi:hypothetical protein
VCSDMFIVDSAEELVKHAEAYACSGPDKMLSKECLSSQTPKCVAHELGRVQAKDCVDVVNDVTHVHWITNPLQKEAQARTRTAVREVWVVAMTRDGLHRVGRVVDEDGASLEKVVVEEAVDKELPLSWCEAPALLGGCEGWEVARCGRSALLEWEGPSP